MKKALPLLSSRIIFILTASILISFHASAQNEDSCRASMWVGMDVNDPLLVHFYFNGTVPGGSFQFLGAWDFGDGDLSGDSCPSHQYAQPGTYVVCLSFSICLGGGLSCHDDTCMSVTVGNISGINNMDGNLHSIYFYPNPVKSLLHFRSDANRNLELKIKDMTGQLVYTGFAGNDEAIDVSSLAAGVYLIEASDGKGIIQRKMVLDK
jgi:hypothetical protein